MNGTDRVQELRGLAHHLVTSLAEGHTNQWDQFMATAARFHSYSWGNRMLIHAQMPTATRVAGYEAWKQKFDRHVARGARAIWILAPMSKRIEHETIDGETVTETKTFFRGVSVFDVSQTICCRCDVADCADHPLALEWAIDVADDYGALAKLQWACPYPVAFEEMPAGDARGWTDGSVLHIRSNMGAGSQVGTLAHEWAHALLHFGEQRPERDQGELEAEIAAHIVSLTFGVERHSRDYLLSWTANNPASETATKKLALAIERAVRAASTILASVKSEESQPELRAA